jgi:glycosyltransferase involved in cell wall biosynthesis
MSPYTLDTEASGKAETSNAVAGQTVFYDGVFKGDYSLAIVNRYLASALIDAGIELTCHTPEKHWQTDRFLSAMPQVKARMRADYPRSGSFDIHLRNTWPPVTHNMVGRFNALVCFAWEESELPQHLVETFNRDLDLIMVTAQFVADAFRHSGVSVPVHVVGDGCDHILDFAGPAAAKGGESDRAISRILHVSSGFLRKGPDLLIEAFVRSFDPEDNVELIVKTFPNPDNVFPSLLEQLRLSGKAAPPITVIDQSYSYDDLAALYRSAAMLVAPSRGEGFGLPLAEAMVLGVPVVTTNYGGQVDFCGSDTAWLVDAVLAPSRSHLAGLYSMWAEPDIDVLGAQMRAVLQRPGEARLRSERAKALLRKHFTWRDVARRVERAIIATQNSSKSSRQDTAWAVDLVSSWQQPCGIATYAGHLFSAPTLAPHLSTVFARQLLEVVSSPAVDALDYSSLCQAAVHRLWGRDVESLMQLVRRLQSSSADVLWIQHHPGHFSVPDMEIVGEALQRSQYRVRAITMHNVRETLSGGSLQWTLNFDVVFVHNADEAAVLSAAGHKSLAVIPHGIARAGGAGGCPDGRYFTVGTFGFLTPHKNVDRLIVALAYARQFKKNLRLKILSCVRANDAAACAVRAKIENLIEALDLQDFVTARFDFIPEQELIAELESCNAIAFPYGDTTEAATGAVRIAMSADRPILCSQARVLSDLWPVSHVLKSDDSDCLAEALLSLSQSDDLLQAFDPDRRKSADWYSYDRVAQRYTHHLEKFLRDNHQLRKAA